MSTIQRTIEWPNGATSTIRQFGGWWVYEDQDGTTILTALLSTVLRTADEGGATVTTVRPKPTPKKSPAKTAPLRRGDKGYPTGLANLLAPRR